MCQVWLKRNKSSLSYEGLNKLEIQTTLDQPCWKIPKTLNHDQKLQKQLPAPHSPFQCWKIVKYKLLSHEKC